MSQESGPSRASQPEPSEDLTAEGKAGEPITLPILSPSGPATGYASPGTAGWCGTNRGRPRAAA